MRRVGCLEQGDLLGGFASSQASATCAGFTPRFPAMSTTASAIVKSLSA